MSGGVQPQFDPSIAPVSFVPGVNVGAFGENDPSARSAGGAFAAAFAAANAAGSRTSSGRTLPCVVVGAGRSATSTVPTSVAVSGVPTVALLVPAAPPLAASAAESVAATSNETPTARRLRGGAALVGPLPIIPPSACR